MDCIVPRALAAWCLGGLGARAEAPPEWSAPASPDKSAYRFLHRTPPGLLRDLESDRPDLTESPITVDAGWFQVEADLFSYTYSKADGLVQEDITAPSLNLKMGLLPSMDLQVVLQPYSRSRVEDRTVVPRQVTTVSGFGDMQVRAKINLWGNDGGRTALAVMPFLHIPTGTDGLSSDAVEGGLIFPFAFELPAGFGVGMMWEVDFIRNAADHDYHAEFIQTLALGRDLTKCVSAYIEFFSLVSTESGSAWIGQIDFGLNYLLTENIKLDAGLNIGVTRAAPDWNPFLGMTWRF